MTCILFEPHLDDAALFAAYTVLLHRPLVVTVLGDSRTQLIYGVKSEQRIEEQKEAMGVLGADHVVWPFRDDTPDWDGVQSAMEHLRDSLVIDRVFVPAWEPGGHIHHNLVNEVARDVFMNIPMNMYMTYERGGRRSRGREVAPADPSWPARKFRAMACYSSQINLIGNTSPWFFADDAHMEFVQS